MTIEVACNNITIASDELTNFKMLSNVYAIMLDGEEYKLTRFEMVEKQADLPQRG